MHRVCTSTAITNPMTRLAVLVVGLVCINAQANLIQNGDFETPDISGNWRVYSVAPGGFEWQILPPSIDLVNTYWEAASGDQSLDLDGGFPGGGGVFQDVTTTPGTRYYLSFAFSGNPDWQDIGANPLKPMEVFWGGQLVDLLTFDVTGHTFTDMGWTYYQYQLVAIDDITRVAFHSPVTYQSATGPAIDDVVLDFHPRSGIPISGVPDSGSLALPFLGVVAAMMVYRRRQESR